MAERKTEHYLNFSALRAGLYDSSVSERARLLYVHLLEIASSTGSNTFNKTEPQLAMELGIFTQRGGLGVKQVQRALGELEQHGYLRKWQQYKVSGCPLTICLNFSKEWLHQKEVKNKAERLKTGDKLEQKSEQTENENSKKSDEFVQPILSDTYQDLSHTYQNLSTTDEEFCEDELVEYDEGNGNVVTMTRAQRAELPF